MRGGNLKVATPDEIRKRYGRMFCQGFYTLVDDRSPRARLIERCIAKGPVEWDAVNRMKAGGAVERLSVDGTNLVMDVRLGEGDVRFGPTSRQTGAQALKSVSVRGDEVHTTWLGLAGASIGVGACLAQAPGVIRAEYHTGVRLGGSRQVEITIVTPKLLRLVVGIDDTDTKEKGATWALALKICQEINGAEFLAHRIIQLNPNVKEKTTNCASTGLSFGVRKADLNKVMSRIEALVGKHTYSDNTALAFWAGLQLPRPLERYGLAAKRKIVMVEEARRVAERNEVRLMEVTGSRGLIGALAAVGCFDMGLEAAGI